MTKHIFAVLLVLLCGAVQAQLRCAPKTARTPSEPGTIVVTGATATGDWSYYWCPDVLPGKWRLQVHAVLAKYRGSVPNPLGLVRQVLEAPALLPAINAAVAEATIRPAMGSQDEFEFLSLVRAACVAATTPPPEMVPQVRVAVESCPAAPVRPGPQPAVWRTPTAGNTLYSSAAGRLTARISGRTAPPGALCDCTAPVAVGTSTYCPLAAPGSSPQEVTLCKKVAP
jgi:hypothetical protein